MGRTANVILSGLLLVILSSAVQGQSEFRVGPFYEQHFGETKFDLDFGFGKSELVFPLDVSLAGVELGWRKVVADHSLWTITARWSTAVNEPGGQFTDRDWLVTETMGLFEISSTRSNVDGSLTDLDVEITRLLTANAKRELALVVGLGYQKIKQRALDVEGTQVWPDSTGLTIYEVWYDSLALTYEVTYLRPQIGLMPKFILGRKVSLELRAVVSPFLQAKDIDDHVLRYFQSRADGKGFGYAGRFTLAYQSGKAGKSRLFGKLVADVQRARVEVSGARTYYADNPAEGFEAGEGFSEERTLMTLQYGVRLHLGVVF